MADESVVIDSAQLAVSSTPADSVVPAGTNGGRFVKGVSGNPAGRPVGRKSEIRELQQKLELAVRKHVSPNKLKTIVEKIANKAANGDTKAAKLIFDYFLSKPSEAEDDNKAGGITIRIENATFKAQQPTAVNVAVEGEFTEVK